MKKYFYFKLKMDWIVIVTGNDIIIKKLKSSHKSFIHDHSFTLEKYDFLVVKCSMHFSLILVICNLNNFPIYI